MNRKELEELLLSLPNAKLDYPFGEEVAVYKVFIPEAPLATRIDEAQGSDKTSSEPYVGTVNENLKSADAAIRDKSQQGAGSARAADETARGEWKMFALVQEKGDPIRLSLKCDPQLAILLREKYESVMEGYHLNKKHWNTMLLTGQVPEEEVKDLITHSYNLVIGLKGHIPEVK